MSPQFVEQQTAELQESIRELKVQMGELKVQMDRIEAAPVPLIVRVGSLVRSGRRQPAVVG